MTDLQDLLPHRPPMLLISELLDHGPDFVVAAAKVTATGLLVQGDRGLPSWALIEYFAQTAALLGGLRAREAGSTAGQGYLLGTRKFESNHPWIKPGVRLVFEAREQFRDGNGMGAYGCRTLDGPVSAECVLNVFTPPPKENAHA